MSRSILIVNPLDGGKSYTTSKRAMDFVRHRIAVIEDGKLRFTLENQAQRQAEIEFQKYRGARVYWNGSDPNPMAMHRPGAVRS